MPMKLVKKNPRGKVIRELSSEEETAVKTVCGLKKPATTALHTLANELLREMREYDAWLQCDCIPGDLSTPRCLTVTGMRTISFARLPFILRRRSSTASGINNATAG